MTGSGQLSHHGLGLIISKGFRGYGGQGNTPKLHIVSITAGRVYPAPGSHRHPQQGGRGYGYGGAHAVGRTQEDPPAARGLFRTLRLTVADGTELFGTLDHDRQVEQRVFELDVFAHGKQGRVIAVATAEGVAIAKMRLVSCPQALYEIR